MKKYIKPQIEAIQISDLMTIITASEVACKGLQDYEDIDQCAKGDIDSEWDE